MCLAPAVGPSIGGYIVSLFGWRMIFWAVLPLLLLSFVLGGLSVRQSSNLRRPPFDAMGLLYLAISFTCLLLAARSWVMGVSLSRQLSFSPVFYWPFSFSGIGRGI